MINQFHFLNIWENPGYRINEVRNTGFSVRGYPVYTGLSEKGPFVAFLGKSLVGVNRTDIGKLSVEIRFLDSSNNVLLMVQLSDNQMNGYFAVFAAALVSEIEESSDFIGDVIRCYCREWEVLFHEPEGMQKTIGLVGEMYVLSRLIDRGVSEVSWNGGLKSTQDFLIGEDILAEVKTTGSHSSYVVEVHGISQLDCPDEKSLHVIFVRMVRVEGGDYSVESLLKSIPSEYIGQKAIEEIESLTEKLKNLEFNCIECRDYTVDSDFPVLTHRSMAGIMNSDAIVDVNYKVNLQSLRYREFDDFLDSIREYTV